MVWRIEYLREVGKYKKLFREYCRIKSACPDGTLNILNSNSELIKSVNVGSGQTESTQINDTAIKVRNTNGDIVATQISLGGAVSADIEVNDTDIS